MQALEDAEQANMKLLREAELAFQFKPPSLIVIAG